jgi:hypothetical protein
MIPHAATRDGIFQKTAFAAVIRSILKRHRTRWGVLQVLRRGLAC